MMHTLTRSASLTDYEHIARSVGLDPFRMLRMAKLPAKVLDDPNSMISVGSVGRLLDESARLSGQEAFGLLLAETRSLGNLGMLALLIREEPTLRAAVQSCVRYMRLHNAGVQLRLDDAGDKALLHVGMQGHGVSRQAIEMSTGIALLTRKEATMIAVANFIGLPLLFFSSILIARELIPAWMRSLSLFNPVEWATLSAREPALDQTDWGATGGFLLLLLGFAAATGAFATWAFRAYQRSL